MKQYFKGKHLIAVIVGGLLAEMHTRKAKG